MNQRKYLIKIVSGVVIGGLLLSTGISTFARQRQGAANGKPKYEGRMNCGENNNFKGEKGFGMKGPREDRGFASILPEMVKDGTLTQSDADKIKEYMDKKQEARRAERDKAKSMSPEQRRSYMEGKRGNGQELLSELVSKGVLTQVKADAIRNKVMQKNEEQREARLKEITKEINTLVEKGTITKDQASKVIENIKQQQSERKAEIDKMKSMTEEQRNTYIKNLKHQKGNVLKKMVEDKTLTQEQADAIRKIIGSNHKKNMPRMQQNKVIGK